MILLTRAETRGGHRYELPDFDTDDLAEARRRATRAAELLGLYCDPELWAGSRVTVHEAATGQLLYVARITRRVDRPEQVRTTPHTREPRT